MEGTESIAYYTGKKGRRDSAEFVMSCRRWVEYMGPMHILAGAIVGPGNEAKVLQQSVIELL